MRLTKLFSNAGKGDEDAPGKIVTTHDDGNAAHQFTRNLYGGAPGYKMSATRNDDGTYDVRLHRASLITIYAIRPEVVHYGVTLDAALEKLMAFETAALKGKCHDPADYPKVLARKVAKKLPGHHVLRVRQARIASQAAKVDAASLGQMRRSRRPAP